MATEEALITISLQAGADLSAKQFYFVKADSSGHAVVAGAGEHACGVLQSTPTSGHVGTVAVGGKSKVIAGASVTAGTLAASDSAGKAVLATAADVLPGTPEPLGGSYAVGVFLTGGSTGDLVEILITHAGLTN